MAKRKRDTDGAGPTTATKSRKQAAESPLKQTLVNGNTKPHRTEGAAHAKTAAVAVVENDKPLANTVSGDRGANIEHTTIQVITGSYERVLHGFAAAIPPTLLKKPRPGPTSETDTPKLDFTDTFLFNAHASSIRCLAVSPVSNETSKVNLATGSTDERINLYSISTAPPAFSPNQPKLPSLHGGSITENPKNKEIGSLLHHSSNITALYFPTRSKLLSAAEDSTIAITRTRDWTALSTIKAPIPKPQGRPSGDTAGPGEMPSGINDFAVHPSMKLMLSVSKGEKCMRLWNLVTGKKAGVLNFGRDILTATGEGRFGSGEGRRVVWNKEGEEFAVAFERGIVVFNIDSKPRARITPSPRTKIHQMHYLPSDVHPTILMVSTEDGRILLYNTEPEPTNTGSESEASEIEIPMSKLIAQIGGPAAGIVGRVKDFEVLPYLKSLFLVVAGSSDGTVRFWSFDVSDLIGNGDVSNVKGFTAREVATLLGSYSTGTRITCLKAFPMEGKPDEEDIVVDDKAPTSSSEDESE